MHGEGFSNTAELNQVLFVSDGLISAAFGIFDACYDSFPTGPDAFEAIDYVDGCIDSILDGLAWEPDSAEGYGDVVLDYALGFYGPQLFEVGVPDVEHSGGGFPDLVGIIPVNLSNGLRGESYNVLLYP